MFEPDRPRRALPFGLGILVGGGEPPGVGGRSCCVPQMDERQFGHVRVPGTASASLRNCSAVSGAPQKRGWCRIASNEAASLLDFHVYGAIGITTAALTSQERRQQHAAEKR